MRSVGILLGGMAVAMVGGCNGTVPHADLGDAISRNASVHIVDPDPARAQDVQFGLDGDRAALAITRYKAGKVIPPRELRTSAVGGSGGE